MSIVESITQPSSTAGFHETRIEQLEQQERAMERKSEAGQKSEAYVAATDEYVPEKESASAGLYWLTKDENGTPNIVFDDPAQASMSPDEQMSADQKSATKPENAEDDKEKCTVSTEKVDAEIKRLKETASKLEQQIAQADDPGEVENLKKELQQIESEINLKDNDSYRRQHAEYS